MTAHGAIERPIVNDNSAAARVLPELVQHQFHFFALSLRSRIHTLAYAHIQQATNTTFHEPLHYTTMYGTDHV